MKIAVFSTKPYDRQFLERAAKTGADGKTNHQLKYLETRLTADTIELANGYEAVCVFVNDQLDRGNLIALEEAGVRLIALRCAGFNNVDLDAANELGLTVVRVPSYSPYAVAEHAVGLILTLNRNIHRSYARVREGNFLLNGLLGFDMHDRTVGIIGTGKIGAKFSAIMNGFGCKLLGFDDYRNPECLKLGMEYVELDELYARSDIISLHCPLSPKTHHLIDADAIGKMKAGVMIINTSRGAVIDTQAAIAGLKSGVIGHLGLDVYEEEADLFFEDLSNQVIPDDVLSRLLTFPNVLITGHQGFFTQDALASIAETTLNSATQFQSGEICEHALTKEIHDE